MDLTFWGAAQTVTGSQHLIGVGDQHVLLDCGLYQGRRDDTYTINQHLPFEAQTLAALVLSHAHIDHSGNIPNLVKSGFEGQIHCTLATADLCHAMLQDSGKIQEEDAYFLNKHRKGEPPIEPIYTMQDAVAALKQFSGADYHKPIAVLPNVRVTFGDAGHMLGSAWELIELNEGDRSARLCFSGDLGRADLPILRDPEAMPEADYLIIESTYGNRLHPSIRDVIPQLRKAMQGALRRGGKIVIPSFAVERTQELVYYFNELFDKDELPDVPFYVDSPLAVNVTEVFSRHTECYDAEALDVRRTDHDGNIFGFDNLTYIHSVDESKALNDLKGPAVIISASGMAENGRVLHHLRNTIEDPKNLILFVSYQGENTLGRRIRDGARRVHILGDEFKVRAEVRHIDAFSGHADRNDLLDWVKPQARNLRGVFVVHGEPDSARALADGMRELGVQNVQAPVKGQSVEL
ncbi:MAG: MBL fold metallo-hydrolase [Chloroflexi bacterium]|nr:MBL fold metallo-hydrolase [Chloroflexota bacterium]MCL5275655.1 MBL fold metallo-hydrolase [Chloroflexota bacterium]